MTDAKLEENYEELKTIEALEKNKTLDNYDFKVGVKGKPENVAVLVKKLSEVLGNVGHVEKNGRNDYHKYDYATESDILNAVRPELSERGIFLFSSVEDYERGSSQKDTISIVKMLYTFIDGETGASVTVRYVGEGQDRGDKSLYKAFTGSTKYAILKNFLISTDDDPEKNSPKRKVPTTGQLIKKIQSQYKANSEEVEKIISKHLEKAGKENDISLLKELNKQQLVAIIKENNKI